MYTAIAACHYSKMNVNKTDLSIIQNFYILCAIFAKSTKVVQQCRKFLNFNGLRFIKQQIIHRKTSKNVFEGHSSLDNIDAVLDYVYLAIESTRPRLFRPMGGYENGVCSFSKE